MKVKHANRASFPEANGSESRAIARHPRAFLMDEPLSNPEARLRV